LLAGLFFACGLGGELELLTDAGGQLHVVIGVEIGGTGNECLGLVVGVRKRKCARELERGFVGTCSTRGVGRAVLVGNLVEYFVEGAVSVLEAAVVGFLGVLLLFFREASGGGGGVGRVERAADAESQEGR